MATSEASRLAQDQSGQAQSQHSAKNLLLPGFIFAVGGIGTLAWVSFLLELLMDVFD
jgi:hypothetical protein